MTSCPSFSHEKKYQVEHYFPANFLCRLIKVTDDVITLDVTREDIVWQMLFCCGLKVFFLQNCQSYKKLSQRILGDFLTIIIYF